MGIMLGLLVVGVVSFAFLVYFAAQDKKFFTAPREGTAEFVMEGNRVRRMIAVWKGHHQLGLDDAKSAAVKDSTLNSIIEQYRIAPGEPTHGLLYYLNPLNWMQSLGIYWIGLWPFIKIYLYDFIWTEEKVTEDGKIVPHTRRAIKKGGTEEGGQTPFVKINDTNYFFVVNDVKTRDGVPLKFILLVTIRVENPYKALFSGADWLERTGGAIRNMTIRCGGVRSYEEVTASTPATLKVIGQNGVEESITKTLEEFIVMLGDGTSDVVQGKDVDLLTAYGVCTIAAKIHEFDFADEDAAIEYRKATTQMYVAKQKGLGEQAEANGKAEAIKTLANAEEYRINKIYQPVAGDDKEARMKIRQLEALEKSGDKGGNTIVIPDEVLGLARKFTQK